MCHQCYHRSSLPMTQYLNQGSKRTRKRTQGCTYTTRRSKELESDRKLVVVIFIRVLFRGIMLEFVAWRDIVILILRVQSLPEIEEIDICSFVHC